MNSPHNNFIYWEDMWNEKPEKNKTECCGQWDKDGTCACGKK